MCWCFCIAYRCALCATASMLEVVDLLGLAPLTSAGGHQRSPSSLNSLLAATFSPILTHTLYMVIILYPLRFLWSLGGLGKIAMLQSRRPAGSSPVNIESFRVLRSEYLTPSWPGAESSLISPKDTSGTITSPGLCKMRLFCLFQCSIDFPV